jgi:hypothetical protein
MHWIVGLIWKFDLTNVEKFRSYDYGNDGNEG